MCVCGKFKKQPYGELCANCWSPNVTTEQSLQGLKKMLGIED